MKASVYIATSLDGFIARKDGSLDWLPQPDVGSDFADTDDGTGFQAFMDSVDALVMGRHTYEQVLSFGQWPYGDKPVIVLSSRRLEIPDRLCRTVESSTALPRTLVEKLAERGMGHLYVDGGKTIQSFLNEGLISQLIITRIPVLIGSGIPLFGPLARDVNLRHEKTRSLPGGMVQSTYQILHQP